MNYQDEDEENNLFYQKYKKSKSKKDKKENPLIQTEIETTTINLQRKRQRHDSDSSDNEEENKDNNKNSQIEDTKPKIEIEFTNNKNIINLLHNIPDEISNEIFNKKDPKNEKMKKITKNYENLSTWMKGIIKFEEKEKQKAAEDLKKNNDDPMKRILNTQKTVNSNDPIEKQRGFYLPKCKFAMSINRFGIEPGYRWDGVDRSNGFEKKYFEVKNQKKEKQTEYYKLRTEEM